MKRLIAATFFLASGLHATAAEADATQAKAFWEKLHQYETTALNDYRSRNMSPVVLTRSHNIWDLQTASPLEAKYASCISAAQNLSYMVSSTYYASEHGRVPVDWYTLAGPYQEQRAKCLEAIGISSESYPLPWWFGR